MSGYATVKSTPQAIDTIESMKRTITGGLMGQLDTLRGQGGVLSDGAVWDGPTAVRFREDWPLVDAELRNVVARLEQLQVDLMKVQHNIQIAGGGM